MNRQDKFINKAKLIHGNKYDYSRVVYVNSETRICITCPEHGEFWQTPHAHLRGQGCPKCGIARRALKLTATNEEFILKAKKIHGERYDYSKVNYVNNHTKVCIICPEHGEFWQTPHDHLSGYSCAKCAGNIAYTKETFINSARKIHEDKYDYSKVDYRDCKTEVCIICPKHGEFWQKPEIHLRGCGCPKCGVDKIRQNNSLTTEEFIHKARLAHGDKYDYSESNYITSHTPIKIICPKHGEFWQKPNDHLCNHGCPKCVDGQSHIEKEVYDFIQSILPDEKIIIRDREIINNLELDIFIPNKNIAFEFDGLYWHSEAHISDHNYHLQKTNACEEKNIQLIHIFEDEWRDKQDICKSRIKNLLGANNTSIMARKCQIQIINNKEAKVFFDTNHLQGNVFGTVTLGLYYHNELVSAMSFGKTRKNMGRKAEKDTFELLRFCNKLGVNVIGGASKLLSHFIRDYKPVKIISYADRRWSQGKIYEVLGFTFIHNSNPSYYYIINNKRKNRFAYRKDILVSKYNCPKNMSEHDFCFSKGWYRIYDCGAKLYEINCPNKKDE